MAAKAWIQERAVEFWDYEVQVKIVPERRWTPGFGRIGKRKPTNRPDVPFVELKFSGQGISKSDRFPLEPRYVDLGLALPQADALKLAHAVLLACGGEDVDSLSKIELKGAEGKRSLLRWKIGFRASREVKSSSRTS